MKLKHAIEQTCYALAYICTVAIYLIADTGGPLGWIMAWTVLGFCLWLTGAVLNAK